jgi:UDP-2,3-diacylglucosamine pyrophosphatase LpxH
MGLVDSQNLRRHFRSLFISDLHLGSKACQTELILNFLMKNEADTIYLVGDVFDSPRRESTGGGGSGEAVARKLRAESAAGRRVVYIAGNHDNLSRRACSELLGNTEIVDRVVHLTPDARRLLVIHGDCFDLVAQHARWLTALGCRFDHSIRSANFRVNKFRRFLGLRDWHFMKAITAYVNFLVARGERFSRSVKSLALEHMADGIICGHFHSAEIHQRFGLVYANCGDWLDSCTAIAERVDGGLEVLNWTTPPAPQQQILYSNATALAQRS